LAGDDVVIVIGWHKDRTCALLKSLGGNYSLVEGPPLQQRGGTIAPRGSNLCDARHFRHVHSRRNAEKPCGKGYSLGMVSSACSDNPARPLVVTELAEPIIGAAQFERSGTLQCLGFEIDSLA
jgi:hypothetical protein